MISGTNKKWALIIGIGLALFPIHNLWLTNVTSIGGMALIHLPAFGAIIWIMAVLLFILNNWQNLDWGDKKIFIPLLVIVASMGLSGFINGESLGDKVYPLFIGWALFFAYVVSRSLGKDIFKMLIPFVCLGAVIAVILGILNPGVPSGGLITNYCASAGFLIFGAVVNQGKWQWALIAVALIGLFFIGALEAVFILGVLGITVLIRRDFSTRFIIAASVLVGLIGLWALLGYLTPLYEGNQNLAILFGLFKGDSTLDTSTLVALTTGRWEVIVREMRNISFIGHGYSLSTVGGQIVHNIPLIIVHQIGPIAGIAWLFVTVYCAIKTKWKYAWIAILAMGVFDHYIWTQFGALYWVLVGVSTSSTIKSDLIFRRANRI